MERPSEKQFIRAAHRMQTRQAYQQRLETDSDTQPAHYESALVSLPYMAMPWYSVQVLGNYVRQRWLLKREAADDRVLIDERLAEGINPDEDMTSFVRRRLRENFEQAR